MGKPFYVVWDRTIERNRDIRKAVYDAVTQVFGEIEELSETEIPVKLLGYFDLGSIPYGNPEWYLEKATNRERGQVDAEILYKLFTSESYQKHEPHHEFFIHSRDMYFKDANFIFGMGRSPYLLTETVKGVILSINRLLKWYGDDWSVALEGLMMHEIGHFYTLPTPHNNPNYLYPDDTRVKTPLDVGHCDDKLCIMEQINVQGRMDLLEKTKYVKMHNPRWYCDPDIDMLKRIVKDIHS